MFADNRFCIENFFISDRSADGVTYINRPQTLFQINGAGDFYRRCAGMRRKVLSGQPGIIVVNDSLINAAVIPGEFLFVDQLGQCVGAGGIYNRHSWYSLN